jgi:hypothetical protein
MGMISIFLTISKPTSIELLILSRLRFHTSIQQRPADRHCSIEEDLDCQERIKPCQIVSAMMVYAPPLAIALTLDPPSQSEGFGIDVELIPAASLP